MSIFSGTGFSPLGSLMQGYSPDVRDLNNPAMYFQQGMPKAGMAFGPAGPLAPQGTPSTNKPPQQAAQPTITAQAAPPSQTLTGMMGQFDPKQYQLMSDTVKSQVGGNGWQGYRRGGRADNYRLYQPGEFTDEENAKFNEQMRSLIPAQYGLQAHAMANDPLRQEDQAIEKIEIQNSVGKGVPIDQAIQAARASTLRRRGGPPGGGPALSSLNKGADLATQFKDLKGDELLKALSAHNLDQAALGQFIENFSPNAGGEQSLLSSMQDSLGNAMYYGDTPSYTSPSGQQFGYERTKNALGMPTGYSLTHPGGQRTSGPGLAGTYTPAYALYSTFQHALPALTSSLQSPQSKQEYAKRVPAGAALIEELMRRRAAK